MKRFRKKPVIVSAMKWDGSTRGLMELKKFCESSSISFGFNEPARVRIKTPEGVAEAIVGDWIIRGIRGEYYPCKDDIFRETYEEVAE